MILNYNQILKLEKWDSLELYLGKKINIIIILLNLKMIMFSLEE